MANDRSPDGGIDADSDILINGGTVIALGTRNDASSSTSKQSFMGGYVGWAAENELVIGDGKGKFMPNANLTAEQMKLVITRYVELRGLDISVDDLVPNTLTGTMTRAELATVLSKLL
ncbi:hypothetical protein D3C80_1482440 [compost metagenome]